MICEDIRAALSANEFCEETDEGARIVTDCLYPSFEPVCVFVARFGEGYRVSDGGGAATSAWQHGREESRRTLAKFAVRYGVESSDGVVHAYAPSTDWLQSAVLGVANASAAAAHAALERAAQAAEQVLSERIFEALSRVVTAKNIAKDFEYHGVSGKHWKADFAVSSSNDLLIVNAVTPHPISISAKYVAFADVDSGSVAAKKFAVHDRSLNSEDTSLITQVASLVPIRALEGGVRRALSDSGLSLIN